MTRGKNNHRPIWARSDVGDGKRFITKYGSWKSEWRKIKAYENIKQGRDLNFTTGKQEL